MVRFLLFCYPEGNIMYTCVRLLTLLALLTVLVYGCQQDEAQPGPSGTSGPQPKDSLRMPGLAPESLPPGLNALDSQQCRLVAEGSGQGDDQFRQQIRYDAQSGLPQGIAYSDGIRDTFMLSGNRLKVNTLNAQNGLIRATTYFLDPETRRVLRLSERDSTGFVERESSFTYNNEGFLTKTTSYVFARHQGARDTVMIEKSSRDITFGRLALLERNIIEPRKDSLFDTTRVRLTYDYDQGTYRLRNFQAAALRLLLGLEGRPATLRVRNRWTEVQNPDDSNFYIAGVRQYRYFIDSARGLIDSVRIVDEKFDRNGNTTQRSDQISRFSYDCNF